MNVVLVIVQGLRVQNLTTEITAHAQHLFLVLAQSLVRGLIVSG